MSNQKLVVPNEKVAMNLKDFIMEFNDSGIDSCWTFEQDDGKVRIEWTSSKKFYDQVEYVGRLLIYA